jgi:hypothetical protein
MDTNEIIEALGGTDRVYPREAVQAAMDQKDEIVPLLLEQLTQALEGPEKYAESNTESFLPIHAVYLLSYHRAREAHPLLVALMSLPGEMPFHLFGDAVHEGIPMALWNTCGGNPTDIIRLIENRAANEYCRSSAIQALTYGVAEKTLPREDVVKFLQGLFTGDEAAMGETLIWDAAASALADLWPGESMDILRKAYEDRLIDPGYINIHNVEFHLNQGKETQLAVFDQKALKDLGRTPHENMQHWAYFNPRSIQRPLFDESLAEKRRRTTAKKKRKQARASRKKGRSKKKKKR